MPNAPEQNTVYLQSGNPETENRPADGYSGGQLGSKITVKVGGVAKTYQLVQVAATVPLALASGRPVYWSDRGAYLVTTDVSAAGRGNVAGIARVLIDVNNVGCIQIKGDGICHFQAAPTATPTAAGLLVIPGAVDGECDSLAAGTAPTTQAGYPIIGKTLGTVVSDDALVAIDIGDDAP